MIINFSIIIEFNSESTKNFEIKWSIIYVYLTYYILLQISFISFLYLIAFIIFDAFKRVASKVLPRPRGRNRISLTSSRRCVLRR